MGGALAAPGPGPQASERREGAHSAAVILCAVACMVAYMVAYAMAGAVDYLILGHYSVRDLRLT